VVVVAHGGVPLPAIDLVARLGADDEERLKQVQGLAPDILDRLLKTCPLVTVLGEHLGRALEQRLEHARTDLLAERTRSFGEFLPEALLLRRGLQPRVRELALERRPKNAGERAALKLAAISEFLVHRQPA
jgi:hypothetical protein